MGLWLRHMRSGDVDECEEWRTGGLLLGIIDYDYIYLVREVDKIF